MCEPLAGFKSKRSWGVSILQSKRINRQAARMFWPTKTVFVKAASKMEHLQVFSTTATVSLLTQVSRPFSSLISMFQTCIVRPTRMGETFP